MQGDETLFEVERPLVPEDEASHHFERHKGIDGPASRFNTLRKIYGNDSMHFQEYSRKRHFKYLHSCQTAGGVNLVSACVRVSRDSKTCLACRVLCSTDFFGEEFTQRRKISPSHLSLRQGLKYRILTLGLFIYGKIRSFGQKRRLLKKNNILPHFSQT